MSNERVAIDLSDGYLTMLSSSGRGAKVVFTDFFIKVLDEYDYNKIADEVFSFVDRQKMVSPSCYICLDSRSVLMKSYFFPFRAASKIEPALDFELEAALSVKRETLFEDVIYGPRFARGTFVTAGCVENEFLEGLTTAFASKKLNIVDITADVCAVLRVSSKMGAGAKLILDIGKERTVLSSTENGLLKNRDLFLKGINAVADWLEQEKFTYDQVYRTLFMTDFTKENLSEEENRVLKELTRLLVQIKNYVSLYNEKTGFAPEVIEICGDAVEIKGLSELFESVLGVKTVNLLPQELIASFEDNSEASCAVRAYGLLLTDRNDSLSFLSIEQKEFSDNNRFLLTYLIKWFSLLLLSLLMIFCADLFYKVKIIKKNESQTALVLKEALPHLQGGFSHAQKISVLKSRINEIRSKLNNDDGTGSTIEVLRRIHTSEKANLKIVIDELTLDPRRLAISGTAASFKDVETFRTELGEDKFFSEVSIKGASAEKKTNLIRFTLELLRAPTGD